MTHTYAILDVSPEAYAEIRAKLEEAGYQHAFHTRVRDGEEVIDMHGIALRADDALGAAPRVVGMDDPETVFCKRCGEWRKPKPCGQCPERNPRGFFVVHCISDADRLASELARLLHNTVCGLKELVPCSPGAVLRKTGYGGTMGKRT